MTAPLDVLFIWHFHQPYYRVPDSDEFVLPWVRLHSVKAYYDMARLLEDFSDIRATFNFSGSLLRQIVEYVDVGVRDRWWNLSLTDPDELDLAERRDLVRHFFSINHQRFVHPNERYRELLDRRHNEGIAACAESFDRQDFLDLQALFNLAWCGFAAREDFPLIQELQQKGRGYTPEDVERLLEVHMIVMAKLLPLYRDLVQRDQIEVTVTPMYHPIIPLVIDTDTARRPTPDRPRPTRYQAPKDAAEHIDKALGLAEALFGKRPEGMWPSEGSVSPEALELFKQAGVSWIATDEDILRCSRGHEYNRDRDLWRSWRLGDSPRIYFRDHGLSDQIGFVYSNNPADEAARNLVENLRRIQAACMGRKASTAIILDGENPWEHYEDDGKPFLTALYKRLRAAKELVTNVPSKLTEPPPGQLATLHSGSWIMANYQIWIGHEETNTAWEWVRCASERLREAEQNTPDHPGLRAARESLFIAQGSDWFWWYGDDFSSEQDDQFDALFRALIARVWRALDEEPPAELRRPIHRHIEVSEQEARHSLPRQFIDPTVDGTTRDFFEWIGAGQIAVAGGHGAMYETFRPLTTILYGFSRKKFFLRLEPGDDFAQKSAFEVHVRSKTESMSILLGRDLVRAEDAQAAFKEVGEIAITCAQLEVEPGDEVHFFVTVQQDGLQVQRFPTHDVFTVRVPSVDPSRENWLV